MALLVLAQFGFDFDALIAKAIEVHPKDAIMGPIFTPGAPVANSDLRRFRLGLALMFGTAACRTS